MIQFKLAISLFTLLFLGIVLNMCCASLVADPDASKPGNDTDTGYINSTGYFQYEFPFLEHRCDYE